MQETFLLLICIAVSISFAHSRSIERDKPEKLENRTIETTRPTYTGLWTLYPAINCGAGPPNTIQYIYSGTCIPESIYWHDLNGGWDTFGQSYMFTYESAGYYKFQTFQDNACVIQNMIFNLDVDLCENAVAHFPTLGTSYPSYLLE